MNASETNIGLVILEYHDMDVAHAQPHRNDVPLSCYALSTKVRIISKVLCGSRVIF